MKLLNHFARLNRRERMGLIILSVLLATVIFMRLAIAQYYEPRYSKLNQLIDSVEFRSYHAEKDTVYYIAEDMPIKSFSKPKKREGNEFLDKKLFLFNPNTISADSLKLLGFSAKTTKTFINFRNKGAKFYKPEDLSKVYGISHREFKMLEPYIKIPSRSRKHDVNAIIREDGVKKSEPAAPKDNLEHQLYTVDINEADSASLVKVKGIGPFYAKEIIKLRRNIGGIHKLDDLLFLYKMDEAKLYGLRESLSIYDNDRYKIPINTVGFKELYRNPMLNKNQINAILNYRENHGNFNSIDDLAKVKILSAELLEGLAPRISFKPRVPVQN